MKSPEELTYQVPVGEGEAARAVEVKVRRLEPVGEGSARLDIHIPEMNRRFYADKGELRDLSTVLRAVIEGEGE